ncbi:hypothetical protein ACSSUR_22455 [Pseudomonas cedrina]|uniref:hypothetical protein n=1 Tax=Pseudomonas cedrina TaxID=651740 RepID=UPI003EDAFCAB
MKAKQPNDKPAIESEDSLNWQRARLVGKYSERYIGTLEVTWLKLDKLRFQTDQYMITGDIKRKKANINVEVYGNVTGSWKVNSPDSMYQDGQWRPWLTEGNFLIGASTIITVIVTFIFDMPDHDGRIEVKEHFLI